MYYLCNCRTIHPYVIHTLDLHFSHTHIFSFLLYSDLEKYRDLSGSRSSLANKVSGLRDSARKSLRKFRRAVSLDRLDKAGQEKSNHDSDSSSVAGSVAGSVKSQIFKRSPSIRSLAERLSFRNKKKGGSTDEYGPPGVE